MNCFFQSLRMTIAVLMFTFFLSAGNGLFAHNPEDSTLIKQWENLDHQSVFQLATYQRQLTSIHYRMASVDSLLAGCAAETVLTGQHLYALLLRQQLAEERRQVNNEITGFQTSVRYRKGLEVIKLLYEKVLALDHHFTSLQTQQHIMALSNPNSFPAFEASKEKLQQKLRKENTIDMPPLLQANPYFSAAYMLVTSVISLGDSKQKGKELEEISCILDFTMQMHADLHIVNFETQYLNESNRILREECSALFAEYVKPLGYFTSLDICRKQDDWENVYKGIENYLKMMDTIVGLPDETSQKTAYRYQVDLDFAIDRLLDFINKYETFVSQGLKYYQKFQVIVNSYAHEQVCAQQLPLQFANLKKEIILSIEKFGDSYSLPEIKGSRLKDLLYGIN
jgi:hypothetical protein